jgi:putative ABC transport system permease protein
MLEVLAGIGAALLTAMLAVAAHDLVRRPGFRRLAMRNMVRRRTEAILVVLGSSLGTAIIAAAFLVGSTFNASVRDGARTKLGPIDEQVTLTHPQQLAHLTRTLTEPVMHQTDGVLATVRAPVSVTATVGGVTRADGSALAGELDLPSARAFGDRPSETGLRNAGPTPAAGEVLIGTRLAGELDVTAGKRITLHAYGSTRRLVVRRVLPEIGLAGATDLLVEPGTLEALVRASGVSVAQRPTGMVLVSNQGGVFDSTGPTSAVVAEIKSRTDVGFDVEVEATKRDLLRNAQQEGRSMGQLYTGVGTFSVLAGVLLLVNLFVMLAEERKRELGLARATGLKRWDLMRVFTLEGACYGVVAAFIGVIAGTGIAWLVARAAGGLLNRGNDPFVLRFVVPTGVLITAGLIGLGLSMATVWITSLRIANLNVIRALRDLPEVSSRKHRLRSSVPASIGVAAGVALALWGVVGVVPLAAVLGPPLALVSAFPLLRPVLGRRITTAIASVGILVWCIGVFTFLTRITEKSGVPVFVVQGLVMVGAAVALSTALDRVWTIGLGALTRTGKGLAGRLGLAYPLDRLFRTTMLLAMYALIVFTLTFLAVYGQIFGGQASTFTAQVDAGTDLLVDANPSNPVDATKLAATPGVRTVATLWRSGPRFTADFKHAPTTWGLTGFDASLLRWGVPELSERSTGYDSDRAVFEAVLHDPGLVVVDEQFLSDVGPHTPDDRKVALGDVITAHDPASGHTARFRVVGLIANDISGAGAWASARAVRGLSGTSAVPSRFFVKVDKGADPSTVAADLRSRFVASGVDASTFRSKVDERIGIEVGFFKLMQSYLSIGLIVGIAGLAVVMVRAARERRRQIGMLRTIGFSADVVRHAFLVEASFIALQGIATGVGLGLLVSYQMLSRTAALGGDPLPYSVPWSTVLALAFIPFAASLAVALIPASQAASVNPAEVLRMAE